MTSLQSLAAIGGLYLAAAASPGPNVFVITGLALDGRRKSARSVAWGVSTGSVIWALLAMFGVAALLASVHWLSLVIRLVGAAYLIWLGAKAILRATRPAPDPAAPPMPSGSVKAWRTGLATSLTNPKSGAFWTSVFATTFPPAAPAWLFAATALMIAGLSLGWHLGLAGAFSSARVQAGYRRLRRPIDAVCGMMLVAFGVRLAALR